MTQIICLSIYKYPFPVDPLKLTAKLPVLPGDRFNVEDSINDAKTGKKD